MADRSGLRLGHYQVLRRIGNGGFAEVHLGRHELLDTYVAIKLFNAPVADVDMPDFLQEARIIASLDHQYIIPVLDCGSFPASTYCQVTSLSSWPV
jgi:serine/threonine protein kinase